MRRVSLAGVFMIIIFAATAAVASIPLAPASVSSVVAITEPEIPPEISVDTFDQEANIDPAILEEKDYGDKLLDIDTEKNAILPETSKKIPEASLSSAATAKPAPIKVTNN